MVLFFSSLGMGTRSSWQGGIGTLRLISKHRGGPGRKLTPRSSLTQATGFQTIQRARLRADGGKRPVAGLFAAPTCLGAHPAVLHVHLRGVVLALLPTQPARLGASLKSGPDHRRLGLRLPSDDPSRRGANVRAVEAHGHTAPHVLDHTLAEA